MRSGFPSCMTYGAIIFLLGGRPLFGVRGPGFFGVVLQWGRFFSIGTRVPEFLTHEKGTGKK